MQVSEGRTFIGRLKYKEDLLAAIRSVCENEGVTLGFFSVIGAVSSAKMGYYRQDVKKYVDCFDMTKTLEITSCIGNISLNNSETFVHAHITLADHDGNCFGGHLMSGTKIYAAEYYIKELTGAELNRTHDPETGLSLWPY
ncbi:MAG: PPC domain-containing DNA-binding protein [Candidatus Omnitrophota bacterium]